MDAQTANGISVSPQSGKAVPQVLPSVPFSDGGETTASVQAIEFRSMEQMTREDRDLAADAAETVFGILDVHGAWPRCLRWQKSEPLAILAIGSSD